MYSYTSIPPMKLTTKIAHKIRTRPQIVEKDSRVKVEFLEGNHTTSFSTSACRFNVTSRKTCSVVHVTAAPNKRTALQIKKSSWLEFSTNLQNRRHVLPGAKAPAKAPSLFSLGPGLQQRTGCYTPVNTDIEHPSLPVRRHSFFSGSMYKPGPSNLHNCLHTNKA